MTKKKVLIIGLDGVSWDLLDTLFDKGLLPTLKKMRENGVYGVLESTIPPVTGPAWVSFATGKNPGKHGIYDFIQPKGSLSNLKPVTSKDIKSITFYELLEKAEKKCILINMPVTYPPRIKGVTITSLMTVGNDFIFPKSLKEEIPEFKNYRIVPNNTLLAKGKLREYVQDIRKLENIRFKCAQKLFKRNWDLFFILFSGTDWINHAIYDKLLKNWEDKAVKEAILFYQDIDNYIKWLIENSPPNTNIIIMSDHGFKTYTEIFFINEWLRRKGYLNVVFQFGEDIYPHKFSEKLGKSKKHVKIPLLIVKLMLLIAKSLSLDKLYILYTKIGKYFPFFLVFGLTPNFRETIAYCISSESRATHLNTKEKFHDGVIDNAKTYSAVREKIINELKRLKNYSNEPLFKMVLKKESIYEGYFLKDAPDIILIPNKCILAKYFAPIIMSKAINNDHDLYGVFIAYGPDIKTKTNIRTKIVDIAPTILHMFNLPIPADMDGKILIEIFEPESEIAKRKPKYIGSSYYIKEEIKAKIKKLKSTKNI